MIAYAVRLLATAAVLLFMASFLFWSGWLLFSPERKSLARSVKIDWACPKCDVWSTAFVSRLWGVRARRRALGLCHQRISPRCPASSEDLIILD
jgi:hypothetical protein